MVSGLALLDYFRRTPFLEVKVLKDILQIDKMI